MVDKPPILDLLRSKYAVEPAAGIEPLTGGEENRNFHITSRIGQYVLRVYSNHHTTTGLRKLPEIDFELDFLQAALSNGIPTPQVIDTQAGERVCTVLLDGQPHFAVLFGYAQGAEPAAYTPTIAQATAGVLSALRRTSLSFRNPCPRPWPGDIVRLSLEFYTANHDSIRAIHKSLTAMLDSLYRSASSGYTKVTSADLPTGMIHGDVKLGNLLVHTDHGADVIAALLDFDDYRETFLLEEFTRTVMHDLDSPTRNAIRAGYFTHFHATFAADPTVISAEMEHLSTFLRARLLYDLTAYTLAGHLALVDEVLADQHVQSVILSSL